MVKNHTKRRLINIKEANLKKQSKLILIFICILLFYHDNSKPVLMGQSLTDYNYKSPYSDYQILDESKILVQIVDLSLCTA